MFVPFHLPSSSLTHTVCPLLQVVLSAFDLDASLDVLDHPVLNLIYYTVSTPLFRSVPTF